MYYIEDKIECLYDCGYEYNEIAYITGLYEWFVIEVIDDYIDYLDYLYYKKYVYY